MNSHQSVSQSVSLIKHMPINTLAVIIIVVLYWSVQMTKVDKRQWANSSRFIFLIHVMALLTLSQLIRWISFSSITSSTKPSHVAISESQFDGVTWNWTDISLTNEASTSASNSEVFTRVFRPRVFPSRSRGPVHLLLLNGAFSFRVM